VRIKWIDRILGLVEIAICLSALGFGVGVVMLAPGDPFALKIVPRLFLGATVFLALLWWMRRWEGTVAPDSCFSWRPVGWILLAGVALRVTFTLSVQPRPESDYEAYWESAIHLVKAHEYVVFDHFDQFLNILRAYRPPGAAFVNALAVAVVGANIWAPLAVNVVCFAATVICIVGACRRLLPSRGVYAAAAFLAFWPSAIAMSGLPQAESISALATALLIWLVVGVPRDRWKWPLATGAVIGLSCLVRNSNLILIPALFLLLLRSPLLWRRRLLFGVVLAGTAVAAILPWTLRNLQLLGSPVLVATNGGENFYTANNPNGDGTWSHDSAERIRQFLPDEVRMDRTGFQWSMAWIRSHPFDYLKLTVPKFRALVESDSHGPYWALERGRRYAGFWLKPARAVADLWWIVLWIFATRTLLVFPFWRSNPAWFAITLLGIVPESLFLLFLSTERYHVSMVPAVVCLAAYAVALRSGKVADDD